MEKAILAIGLLLCIGLGFKLLRRLLCGGNRPMQRPSAQEAATESPQPVLHYTGVGLGAQGYGMYANGQRFDAAPFDLSD